MSKNIFSYPQNLCPGGSGDPAGPLAEAIKRDFFSFDVMKEKLSASTVAVQGSGWGWLGYNKASGKLQIATCANQVLYSIPALYMIIINTVCRTH